MARPSKAVPPESGRPHAQPQLLQGQRKEARIGEDAMAVGAHTTKLHLLSFARRPKLLQLAAVAVLCSLSYLVGV